QLVAPVRGYLLTVDVSDAAPGDIVTITFRPPGWTLEIASLVAALVIAAAWSFLYATGAKREFAPAEPPRRIG
ncbi:hypothetical protein ACJBT5_10470, partial [Streptococcus suis]